MQNARRIVVASLLAAAGAASGQTIQSATALPTVLGELFNTGTLVIVTNNQHQQIEIEVGPVAGEVSVFGVDGIPSGMTFPGVTAVELTTGSGQDFVEFRMFGTELPPVTVSTGSNNSDVKFIYETPFNVTPVTSEVTVNGLGGNDIVNFEVISDADSFDASWTVNHGNGNNETNATVLSAAPSSALGIDLSSNTGSGLDKLTASILSGAATVDIGFGGSLGFNNDIAILSIDEQSPGATTVNLGLDLSRGFDTAEILAVTRGGTVDFNGTVLGGTGSDSLKSLIDGGGSSSLVLDGGPGADSLDSEYKGEVTGAPALLGAGGNDFLKIVADQPAFMTPFIDGGAGIDTAIGFGTIVNVENIN